MDATTQQSQEIYINNRLVTVTDSYPLVPQRRTLHCLKTNSIDFPEIVAKQQKVGWEEEFQHEIEAFNRLRELQGTVIPQFFKQAEFDGKPALYLSKIDGINLHDLARNRESTIIEEYLEKQLRDALDAFSRHGAEYGDLRLDNFMLCNDKIMVIDLEDVEFFESYEENRLNLGAVSNLMSQFRDARFPNRPPTPIDWQSIGERSGQVISCSL